MGLKEMWSKVHKTLASVRTGIILLLIVVVFSAVGTLILQRPTTDPDEIQRAYSPATLMWLDRLGLTDVFHAWWFVVLMLLVSLSIIFASLERWPTAWRFYSRPNRRPEPHFRAALPQHAEFKITDVKVGLDAAERVLRKLGLRPERVVENNEVSLYSERHRFSVLAVYIVHLSLLMIFAGGIVDGIYGYRGSLMLTTGDTSNTIVVRNRGGAETKKILPFSIRCDGAGQENYADGSPKRWWSNLVVLKGGGEQVRKQIVVNDPLTYQGIRFYQASFGQSGKVDHLELQAFHSGSAEAKMLTLGAKQAVPLNADTTVMLQRFIPDYYEQDGQIYQRSQDLQNPAIQLALAGKGGTHTVWLFPRESRTAEDAQSGYSLMLTGLKMANFTGLEVSHEPGQWFVWGGVVLMAIGLGVAFYLVHMRFWVTTVFDSRQGLLLWVGGACNKNRERFVQRFDEISRAIGEEIELSGQKSQPSKPNGPAQEETLVRA